MKIIKTSIIGILFVAVAHLSLAQDSLQVKYQNMIESTETFNQYKVIPRTMLDAFWAEAVDSLQQNGRAIRSLSGQVQSQSDSIRSLTAQRDNVQGQLDESLTLNDSISFLGANLTKGTYHFIVWGLILALVVTAIVFYVMFLNSNRVTSRSKKELETLQLAYEEHKNQSREKQVKLKRELQTAINTIDEMKRGRS